MNKPMYKSVDDARSGKVTGRRVPARLSMKSRKLVKIPVEEAEEIESGAKSRLIDFITKIQKVEKSENAN